MLDNVLVGVDGQPGGRDAVALARQLTSPGRKLTLAHVYPYHGQPRIRGYDDDEAAQITRAGALLRAAGLEAAADAQLRWVGATSPGRGLHELAETLNADLLVVGSTRRGLLGRVLIGDDTRAALDGAPCAVAIAPAGYAGRETSIDAVGVGYDGSPESERALVSARAVAAERHATLAALKVVWFPGYLFKDPAAGDATRVVDLIDEARTRVAALGDVEPFATCGQPIEELALWSASLDLLVVGSRGFGPIGRLVHGSTSRELTRRARCPLLVVTRSRGTAAEPPDPVEAFGPAASARR